MNRTRARLAGATAVAALAVGLLGTAPAPAAEAPVPPKKAQKDYEPTPESLNSHPTPAWFDDDKFGIFIHWAAEGVALWDSKVSGRDTVDLGPKRDLAGDLFKAARQDIFVADR